MARPLLQFSFVYNVPNTAAQQSMEQQCDYFKRFPAKQLVIHSFCEKSQMRGPYFIAPLQLEHWRYARKREERLCDRMERVAIIDECICSKAYKRECY